ncbi:CG42503 [Drosophila busckii]|uniref:CG42503 n=1 Tax=Drosophila busckii TaxID=30019 RepID=A0A0M4EHA3_DROBS|nr:molybdopterin synthase sulfur carrier subunit [Drosophila busckii]ALC47928.1 CG42503 [Drosophila busckii]
MSVEESPPLIKVNILFFARSRELAGTACVVLEIEPLIIAKDLVNQLVDRFDLGSISQNLIIAHNETYIENLDVEIHLHQGDEIAVIPPISGG